MTDENRKMGSTRVVQISRKTWTVIVWGCLLAGLSLTSRYHYLLFHTLAEWFAVTVAFGIFIIGFHTRRQADNGYLLFLGIIYLFTGTLDLIHTLGYQGMPIFIGYDANLPTQLWIAARYLESLGLLIAPLWIDRRLPHQPVFLLVGILTTGMLVAVFGGYFPDCFIEGVGLTPCKIISEYIIIGFLLVALLHLYHRRRAFNPDAFHCLTAAISVTILSEFMFTLYADPYSLKNLTGHLLKIVSYALVYNALVMTGLVRPFALLFKNLKESEVRLRQMTIRLAEIDENNRQRLSLLLHDRIGQNLATLGIHLSILENRLAKATGEVAEKPNEARRLLIDTVEATRDVMTELRPGILDEYGLAAALRWWGSVFTKKNDIPVKVETTDDGSEDLPFSTKTALFRIYQEALTNVAKHAQASAVSVALTITGRRTTLTIKDNGIGFDPAARSSSGWGLLIIKEKAIAAGGHCQISSRPGHGTHLDIEIGPSANPSMHQGL
jgi:signal transduction histidine kinase